MAAEVGYIKGSGAPAVLALYSYSYDPTITTTISPTAIPNSSLYYMQSWAAIMYRQQSCWREL